MVIRQSVALWRLGRDRLAMANERLLPRDCYLPHEVRKLLGRRHSDGVVRPVSRMTIVRMRRRGDIEFLKLNCRVILYSRASVDAYLEKARAER